MSNVWYCSDLHIGHKLVSGLRGFTKLIEAEVQEYRNAAGELLFWNETKPPVLVPDTQAHDDAIAANWDRVVKPDDTVYVLGDISINGGQHALDWIEQRPGTKHLISGNHDPVNPMHSRALKLLPHWHKYFATIQPFLRKKLLGETVLLSHYPYWDFGDGEGRGEARYEQYRLPNLGALLLHGHTHGTEQDHDNQFHVGLDAWGLELVPQETILEWVRERAEA